MGINKDLNIDPYFENFYDPANPQYKQYNKILFRPARAVQARELTQLQTILQEQIERFGSNVYQEGTVITGININQRTDIFFVKLKDTETLPDPTIYDPSTEFNDILGEEVTTEYFVRGQTTNIRAKILTSANGFQTRDPDLKTFFINYLTTTQNAQGEDIKQFEAGEVLEILDADGAIVNTTIVAEVANHAGRSFGASVDEGIVYQKGHFVFVEDQLIIIEKYDSVPRDIAIGFNIEENIITSNQDSTLLDNAQGYNNDNAPGADRLQLKPVLEAYISGEEPDNFFSLIRFERGEVISVRNVTEFNSVAKTMARRTFEESGDYVTRGLTVSLEQDATGSYAVVAPGKAYVQGYEVEIAGKKYLPIEGGADEVITRANEATGAEYGMYYEFNWEAPVETSPGVWTATELDSFQLDGTRYSMYNNADQEIGKCSIRSISAGLSSNGATQGRLYVYAIDKIAGFEFSDVNRIENTFVTSPLMYPSTGATVFPTGSKSIDTIRDLRFVQRKRLALGATAGNTFEISATTNSKPLTDNIVVINSVGLLLEATASYATDGSGKVNVTVSDLAGGVPAFVYYNSLEFEVAADGLQQVQTFVKTIYAGDKASIGIPNAIKLLEVIDQDGTGQDITSRFQLVNNAKEGYYDLSYISLKKGESLRSVNNANALRVKFVALRRTSTIGSGYLTADSYFNVDKTLVKPYSAKDGRNIDLVNAIDFRPYASPTVAYATSAGAAQSVGTQAKTIVPTISIADRSTILATHDVFLPRIDAVVVDSTGRFEIVKGAPAEKPSIPDLKNVFQLAEIFVPGGELSLVGNNSLRVSTKTVRNYTMKDIHKFDTRIKRLTSQVALNALEKAASEMFIPDANGDNRFKNGFLVDTFESLATTDVIDPEFKMGIDPSKRVATPAIRQFPVDLRRKTENSNNISAFGEFTSIADDGTRTAIIDQPYATNTRNCVSNFYSFQGSVDILPKFSSDYDTVRNPDISINLDLATPMIDLLETIQEVIPLTRTVADGAPELVNTSGQFASNQGRWRVTGVNETWRENFDVIGIGFDTSESTTQPVGDFVTDINFKPFMKSRDIKILVTGLRPNTRHYFFFADGEDINANVTPGQPVYRTDNGQTTLSVNDVVVKQGQSGVPTVAGQPVRTDENGVLAAIFTIPEGKFYVGENKIEVVDVDNYDDIESSSTSYGNATYRAYNFGVSKASIDVNTRTPDFRTEVVDEFFTDNVQFREISRQRRGDPLAQTFFIKSGMTDGAKTLFISDIDLYFKQKDQTQGVTIELREVINGYPSAKVLPFGRKYLTSSQVNVSDNGTIKTTVTWDNPIRLEVEREYAVVVLPDANSPNYLIWTSKVGGTDLSDGAGTPVTQDWGDGVLFTSTNNRAWKSYQDEDIKFTVKRLTFSAQEAYIDLVPNKPEFLSIENVFNSFVDGEFAYVKKTSGGQYTVSSVVPDSAGRKITVNSSTAFAVSDYIVLEKGSNKKVTQIEDKSEVSGITTLTLKDAVPFDPAVTGNIIVTFVVGGYVSYFNGAKPTDIHISQSSARELYRIIGDGSEQIVGERSGATATITNVNNIPVSYFQPMIYTSNTAKTNTRLALMSGSAVDKSISSSDNVYLTGNARSIPSWSNIVDPGQFVEEDFAIRVTMTNNGFITTSPTLDDDLSLLNVYQYDITNDEATTSTYVSKKASLSDRMYASGLKVVVGAYRPAGTMIDVYARFVFPTDMENVSDWYPLVNGNPDLFSATYNIRDYREFDYNLDETTLPLVNGSSAAEFTAFQVKIVMRHMNQSEATTYNLSIDPDINVFPHLADYRAIAVT